MMSGPAPARSAGLVFPGGSVCHLMPSPSLPTSLQEIESALEEVPALLPQFSELREESRLHQQYEAAVCTMDFTLMIDKFVERAQKVMDQGTLLAAHKVRLDLTLYSVCYLHLLVNAD